MYALGTRAFAVDWQTDVETNEFGDCEPDTGTLRRKVFKTKGVALTYAKKVLPDDYWGCVSVTEVELEDPFGDGLPHTYRWEYVTDSEYITHDE